MRKKLQKLRARAEDSSKIERKRGPRAVDSPKGMRNPVQPAADPSTSSLPGASTPSQDSSSLDREILPETTFPIVGIGASAGGLEAFVSLLRALPPKPGLAFVFIQHLEPNHESLLAELLKRSTSLPVSEALEGEDVKPNRVYVIPRNTNLVLAKNRFHLGPRSFNRGQHLPVDVFLRSLAKDRRNSSIGVVLSGTASDGTLGLQAIKAEGGITFAQDENSARFSGMPHAAKASGAVDYVLTPEGIARVLARLANQDYFLQTPGPEGERRRARREESPRRPVSEEERDVADLRREIAATKDYLQAIAEEQEATEIDAL